MDNIVAIWSKKKKEKRNATFNMPIVGVDEDERTFGLTLSISHGGYHDVAWRKAMYRVRRAHIQIMELTRFHDLGYQDGKHLSNWLMK